MSLADRLALLITAIGADVKSLSSKTTKASPSPYLSVKNAKLYRHGLPVRLGMINAYWLGLDDNNASSPGNPVIPSNRQVSEAIRGMKALGANVIRAHTVGMSAGTPLSFETSAGVFNDANLRAADWAVYQAGLEGMTLICPMTDNWNYYHGGKGVFVHWAYLAGTSTVDVASPTHLFDGNSAEKDSTTERVFFDTTANGTAIRNLFKAYISAWMNHVNQYTGIAYKDDPTIAIIETGNELYYSAQLSTNEWIADISSYIKNLAPNKLVLDGASASGTAVSSMKGLNTATVDIMAGHYYPYTSDYSATAGLMDSTTNFPAGSASAQLSADATAATNAGKAFIVGEYPWTRSDVASWWTAIEGNALISGDAPWAFIANTDAGAAETHGGAFGTDDYPIYWPFPASVANAAALESSLQDHLAKYNTGAQGPKGDPGPNNVVISTTAPTNPVTNTTVWIDLSS